MTRTPENDAITKRQYDDPALRAAMEKHYPYWEWGAQARRACEQCALAIEAKGG